MQSGLINKVAATSAEVTDAQGLEHVCPKSGAVYADKGYCVSPAKITLKRNGCHNATIKKNNMSGKNKNKDKVCLPLCANCCRKSWRTIEQ